MNAGTTVQYTTGRAGLPAAATVRRWVAAALHGRKGARSVTVRFVDNEESQSLNCEWRGKRRPTNVLAFPYSGAARLRGGQLGDLVICVPVARAEALAQHKPFKAHCAHLAVHGVLHLLGHDHDNDTEAERMEAMETAVLHRLGYPDPYTPIP